MGMVSFGSAEVRTARASMEGSGIYRKDSRFDSMELQGGMGCRS
jgi:hypothetical protein